ncbi:MAG TPA: spore coat protein CotH [Eubacterium sp.]|nr:spore coat protein CotH [Eubacterium sp.]
MKMLKKVMGCICLAGLSAVPAACSMNNYDSDMKQTIEQSVPWGDVGKQQDTVSDTSGAGDGRMIYDNTALYENRDPASVVTMYLTVSEGNASDNTDHTWTQVNSYSAYHYDELGIERYAVNGLLQVGDENGPVEGQLGYGQVVPNATVTIRGQTSTRYAQKNYRITIRDNKGIWDDQKVINLNKHEQDQSRFANKLCYDLMSELPGMIAMRTRFVHLYVKDMTEGGSGEFKDYGLYTQVEQLNKRALRSHGLDKNGQLYKINFFEFYRYEDVIMVKNDADYDVDAFEDLIEIKDNDDHSKLIAMLDELNDYSIPITQIMDRWFCRENMFSWMAFHILMGNVDTQSRNVFLYSPLNSDTFYFISWDNDGAFYDTKAKLRSQDRGWEIGISNYWGNVLFRRVLMDNELRAGLDDKIEEYRNIITREKLEKMIDIYAPVVRKYAYSYPDSEHMPLTGGQYEAFIKALPDEVENNYRLYKLSLESPQPFFIGIPQVTDEGMYFAWDASYDFQAQDIYYTLELAKDYTFEKPVLRVEGLFATEYLYEGELEPGQYFMRMTAKNESGIEQRAFDYYVASGNQVIHGVKCFFVMPDGSVQEDVYEE